MHHNFPHHWSLCRQRHRHLTSHSSHPQESPRLSSENLWEIIILNAVHVPGLFCKLLQQQATWCGSLSMLAQRYQPEATGKEEGVHREGNTVVQVSMITGHTSDWRKPPEVSDRDLCVTGRGSLPELRSSGSDHCLQHCGRGHAGVLRRVTFY